VHVVGLCYMDISRCTVKKIKNKKKVKLYTLLSSLGVVFLKYIFVNCICLVCIVILYVFFTLCVCVFVIICICVFVILAVLL
jgi:hypothetical protein